jgi:predicted DNA-binding transcriptional regulator AlpA
MADDDTGKWQRARAIVTEDEALRAGYAEYKRAQALESRFKDAGTADVLRMFEAGVNDKGQPLSPFEFKALCEWWCAVFGELPPMGEPSAPSATPDPLPPDDAMLAMRDVVRITGLSKSTIKRWVNDPKSDFPRPVNASPRRIAWPADQVKAWRQKRIELAARGRLN